MSTAALLLSGGPDSTLLAHELVAEGKDVLAVTFNFGEAEGAAERRCATSVAGRLGLEHVFVDFTGPLSALYHKPAPALLRKVVDWEMDVEPFGSGIAISLAASFALSRGASEIYYAVHQGDAMYRDNVPAYFEHLSAALTIDRGFDVAVRTPYLGTSKGALVARGDKLRVDYANTWSCGAESDVQCGMCMPCVDRQVAFAEAGVADPTSYRHPLSPESIAEKVQVTDPALRYVLS